MKLLKRNFLVLRVINSGVSLDSNELNFILTQLKNSSEGFHFYLKPKLINNPSQKNNSQSVENER